MGGCGLRVDSIKGSQGSRWQAEPAVVTQARRSSASRSDKAACRPWLCDKAARSFLDQRWSLARTWAGGSRTERASSVLLSSTDSCAIRRSFSRTSFPQFNPFLPLFLQAYSFYIIHRRASRQLRSKPRTSKAPAAINSCRRNVPPKSGNHLGCVLPCSSTWSQW